MLNDKGERMVEAVSKEHLWSFDTASLFYPFVENYNFEKELHTLVKVY